MNRGWWIPAFIMTAVIAVTPAACDLTPHYRAEIALSAAAPINPITMQPDPSIAGALLFVMPSIANAAEGLEVCEAVSRNLKKRGIDIAAEELLDMVEAEAELQSPSIRITITDSSPTRAAEIANIWGETLEELTGEDLMLQNPDLKRLALNGTLIITNRAVPPKNAD